MDTNICKKCSHKTLCKQIKSNMHQLESEEKTLESGITFYSLKMMLEEKGFGYPKNYVWCDYFSLKDDRELRRILERQSLLASVKD